MKMVTKKGFVFITIILLIGTGVIIPAINNSSIKTATAEVYKNKNGQQPDSSSFFDPRVTIPEHCFNLSKAPSEYEDESGEKHTEEFNFPIGTFGNNFISYSPHGIDRIALYNNFNDSFGGRFGTGSHHPRCLNGTFLGIYMDDGENKTSKILQQYSPTERDARDYPEDDKFEPVEKMECWSNVPIGYYRYQDAELPADIGLIVYSPVILYDVKNSSLPVSIWVFNAYNPTNSPVEVSFLFSLENDIGWRNETDNDSTWQRTGTYNYIREEEDIVGVKYTYAEDLMSKSHPEYLGEMTLATLQQPDVTISYVSEWDTLGDGKDLLSTFTISGLLSNQTNSDRAEEGEHIYAGALSAKVLLEPGEGKNIPFVLATCFPVFNLSFSKWMPPNALYKWYWTNYFNDSWSIATYALANHEDWWRSINDWQEKLYHSGLPSEMMTYMIGSLASFVSCVFFSNESHWFTVNVPFKGVGEGSPHINWFLCMFYPEIVKYSALAHCDAIYTDGFCPLSLWNHSLMIHQELEFVIREYRAWMWNQDDTEFLRKIYPVCRNVTNYTIKNNLSCYNKTDGLIHNRGNDALGDMWAMPTSSGLNSLFLLSLRCMVSMAKQLNYSDDARDFEKYFEKAQRSFIDRLWYKSLKYEYFKLCAEKSGLFAWWWYPGNTTSPRLFSNEPLPVLIRDSDACMIQQILGVWYGRLLDEDILPLEKTKTALNTIYAINRDHHHGYGWVRAVMGNPPYFIDRFGTYFYNAPNKISSSQQWPFATSLLVHGFREEGMDVAKVTNEHQLYENGGVYVTTDNNTVYLCGTNKRNRVGRSIKDFIKDTIIESYISRSITGGYRTLENAYYPPTVSHALPSWALYQGAAGFTPCIGGLKIKPRVGGEDTFYMTQYAGCKIEMNVTGTGDTIETVEINGAPYNVIVDGKVFIPLEDFIRRDKMFIHITFQHEKTGLNPP